MDIVERAEFAPRPRCLDDLAQGVAGDVVHRQLARVDLSQHGRLLDADIVAAIGGAEFDHDLVGVLQPARAGDAAAIQRAWAGVHQRPTRRHVAAAFQHGGDTSGRRHAVEHSRPRLLDHGKHGRIGELSGAADVSKLRG